MSELNILFDNDYPKLHGQKSGRLVFCLQDVSGMLLLEKLPDLFFYDTLRDDGRYYEIDKNLTYMILFFVGEKGIMFSTIRKQNEENVKLYAESVGEEFRIKINPRSANYGSKQRN